MVERGGTCLRSQGEPASQSPFPSVKGPKRKIPGLLKCQYEHIVYERIWNYNLVICVALLGNQRKTSFSINISLTDLIWHLKFLPVILLFVCYFDDMHI